jgi:hypothetical protein
MERENSPLRIVIGGGGSTGVELAGEIKLWLCGPTAEIKNTCSTSIEIIDGASTVLSVFDPRLIVRAQKRLTELGIATRTNERIASVSKNELTLQSGTTIPFDILVWTGGVKANQLAYAASMKRDQNGKVLTGHDMQCIPESTDLRFHGSIYGIGDSICFINPKTNTPVPGTARAAMDKLADGIDAINKRAAEGDMAHWTEDMNAAGANVSETWGRYLAAYNAELAQWQKAVETFAALNPGKDVGEFRPNLNGFNELRAAWDTLSKYANQYNEAAAKLGAPQYDLEGMKRGVWEFTETAKATQSIADANAAAAPAIAATTSAAAQQANAFDAVGKVISVYNDRSRPNSRVANPVPA